MSDYQKTLSDPRGRAVAVLQSAEQAEKAKTSLLEMGISEDEIQIVNGSENAKLVDDSAKWFADTDEDLERYKRKLLAGETLISVPIQKDDDLKQIQSILYESGARTMTNFGTLVTKTIDLEQSDVG